jgi:hypothetical protein
MVPCSEVPFGQSFSNISRQGSGGAVKQLSVIHFDKMNRMKTTSGKTRLLNVAQFDKMKQMKQMKHNCA